MNLQLFGYDDGFYYGQCKLIFEAETVSDNGKTVTISDGTTTKSGIVVDKKCEFLVPGRSLWIATLLDGSDAIWTGKVEAGYGDCKHIMLADGYEAVMERDILDLDEIKAATNVEGYVASAEAVKLLDNNLGGIQLRVNSGEPEWKAEGADTWSPFSSDVKFVKNGKISNCNTGSFSLDGITKKRVVLVLKYVQVAYPPQVGNVKRNDEILTPIFETYEDVQSGYRTEWIQMFYIKNAKQTDVISFTHNFVIPNIVDYYMFEY